MLAEEQLEDGIAEVFEPLVVEVDLLCLVTQARVRQCLGQEQRIAELITDLFFERMHENAWRQGGK
jgi:hypothetical protein